MNPRILILATLLATPATAQAPPTDPATVMDRVMAAFAGIDRPPAEVMQAFLPEAGPQSRVIGTFNDLSVDIDDPQALFFETFAPGAILPGRNMSG